METQKNTKTRRSQSLRFKIGLTLIVLTTLILAGFGVYQYLALRAEKMAYLTYVANNTIERLVQNLALPLWNFDTVQAEETMLAEMGERTIYAIAVDDTDGNRLLGKIRNELWEIIDVQEEITETDMMRSQDIVKGDESLGRVELHLTQQFMTAELTREIRNIVIAVVIVDLVLLVFLGVSLQRLLIQPLNRLVTTANAVAQGDFRQQIDIRRQDEIGELANAFRAMKSRIGDVVQEIKRLISAIQEGTLDTRGNAETFGGDWRDLVVGINTVIDAFVEPISTTAIYIERVSQGDIPETITEAYQGDFNTIKQHLNSLFAAMNDITRFAERIAAGDLSVTFQDRAAQYNLTQALNTMTQRLNAVVSEVTSATEQVATGSQAMSSRAEEMSQGATEQAASAEQVSSSMEEMAANIHQNAENALQTERIARQSAEAARDGNEAVAEAVNVIKAIAKQINFVEEIASQTHMLSLNATIEAAKAQEYGKGFDVVAAEVRVLAERSRLAAEEITELASSGVAVAEKAGKMLNTLVPNIQHTAELVQGINAASHEQSSGVQQINQALQQLDQVIQQNASNAEEMASTSETLADQAAHLRHTMTFFIIEQKTAQTLETVPGDSATAIRERQGTPAREQSHKISGNDKPSETVLNFEKPDITGDERDDEFERY